MTTTETILTNARWTYFVWAWGDIAKAINVPYSVSLWGSNPDETDNDDCWTGDDYATREEAIAAYRAIVMFPTTGALVESCGHWEFVMIDGPKTHEVTANPDQAACRRHRREMARSDRDWQHERAMEAGMLHGIEAYNDEMNW
jgi:hypothetical protein